jgi:GDP-mannose 6-dehydrogenase
MMNVAVFGLGHVGCVSAVCVARAGHRVVGVDVNERKVRMVNDGESPVSEPGVPDLLAQVVADGRLTATSDAAEAVRGSHVALLCADRKSVDRAGRQIGEAIPMGNEPYTVVLRTAVPPGTTDRVLRPALFAGLDNRPGARARLAVNPEFFRQGSSIADYFEPPMIVVGTDDPGAAALVRSMYSGIPAPFVHTTPTTAELVREVSGTEGWRSAGFPREGPNAAYLMVSSAMRQIGQHPQGWTRPRRMA